MKVKPGTWEFLYVTPEMARQFLDMMPKNRRLRLGRVRKLANAMLRGRYRITHQGIAFNCNGTLKDGQHRLMAIIESGCSQWMWVYRGLQDDAMLVIDSGAPRSAVDGLSLSGMDGVSIQDVAIARRMHASIRSRTDIDPDDLRAYLEANADAIEFARSQFPSTIAGITSAPFLAALARAWFTVDMNRLVALCDIMKSGVATSQQDQAGAYLRDFLKASANLKGDDHRATIYKKAESGILAFAEKRPITRLYGWERELFPIPSDSLEATAQLESTKAR